MQYKILNSGGLGVGGRQNELIELALTHKYDGVEIDMNDLVGRHDTLGKEFACQFLQSARIDLGTFDLPLDFAATDAEFAKQCERLETIIDLAQTLGTRQAVVRIAPQATDLAFQENFEKHRSRIGDVAEAFKAGEIRLGLFLQASKVGKTLGDFKFIQTAEEIVTLVKTIGHPNVGLCIDAFEWSVGDGALDQLSDLDPNQMLTEVRFADLAATADKANLDAKDLLLPGDGENSFSVKLAKLLIEKAYRGPIAIATNMASYSDGNRHRTVEKLSARLAQLAAGEDPAAIAAAAAEAAAAAADDADAKTEGEEATTAKTDDAAPAASAT
jgi:sugar phosphate isomerase/epimerase